MAQFTGGTIVTELVCTTQHASGFWITLENLNKEKKTVNNFMMY
jgi:hypothetical protein